MGLESNDVIIVFESRRDSGVALAKQFVESGARVVLDIPGSDLSDLDPTCIKQSHNRPIRADATINSALSSFGKVNGIVFHVAGQDSDIEDAAYWDTAREVDIKGAFQVAKAAWTIFKNQRCGSMLFSADSTFGTLWLYS
jgi:NAD(P)-dependent dehydrogenase (short-subunit alcohol dehydrogenase family)